MSAGTGTPGDGLIEPHGPSGLIEPHGPSGPIKKERWGTRVGLVLAVAGNAPAALQPSPTAGAEGILAERLARSEISADDYRTTLAALRGSAAPASDAQGPDVS